jgi:hypothetical protein
MGKSGEVSGTPQQISINFYFERLNVTTAKTTQS